MFVDDCLVIGDDNYIDDFIAKINPENTKLEI